MKLPSSEWKKREILPWYVAKFSSSRDVIFRYFCSIPKTRLLTPINFSLSVAVARCIRIGFWLPPCIGLVWLRLVKQFPWTTTMIRGQSKRPDCAGKAQPCAAPRPSYVPGNYYGPKDPREKIVSTWSWAPRPREFINYRNPNTSGFHLTCISSSAQVK